MSLKHIKPYHLKDVHSIDYNALGCLYFVEGTENKYIYLKVAASTQILEGEPVTWGSDFVASAIGTATLAISGVAMASVKNPAGVVSYIFVKCGGFSDGVVAEDGSVTYAAGDILTYSGTAGMVTQLAAAADANDDGTEVLLQLKKTKGSKLVATGVKDTTFDYENKGRVSVLAGALTTVVGDGNCRFTHDYKVGSTIVIGSTAKVIDTDGIIDDNHITISVAMSGAVTAQKHYRRVTAVPVRIG